MKKIKPKWEHGNVHPDSENKVFCTAPWTHLYRPNQKDVCVVLVEKNISSKQYIDARNDAKYGAVKESGTIEDYKQHVVTLKEHWNCSHDGYKKETYGR